MRHAIAGLLLLSMIVLSACAKSEATRCKESGGVWRGTVCERPAG